MSHLRRAGGIRTIMRKEGARHQRVQKDTLAVC